VKKEKVCENLHAPQYKQGSSLREKIQDARRLTGGALFKVWHIAMDKEVLALREAKEQEKTDEQDQIINNAADEYKKKRKGEYEKVQNSPKTADNYVDQISKPSFITRRGRVTQLCLRMFHS
jgi:esterase/lipase